MTKKLIGISGFIFTVIFCLAFIGNDNHVQKSDGGPPYNTKAPGEKTCSGTEGANSCHSGGIPDNSGPGTPSILFSGGTTYVPGQTYTITPGIAHPTLNRFGFQIVSLKDSDNLYTGTIIPIDTNKTRVQQPTWGSYQDRIYIMHRSAGSYPTTPNLGQWSYKWVAPPYNQGKISFYACFLAANNDNQNDGGDQTYYKKITINPSAIGIDAVNESNIGCSVYPNPASELLTVELSDLKEKDLEISILNMQGKLVKMKKMSGNKETIDVGRLEKGLYSVVISKGSHTILSIKKVVINN